MNRRHLCIYMSTNDDKFVIYQTRIPSWYWLIHGCHSGGSLPTTPKLMGKPIHLKKKKKAEVYNTVNKEGRKCFEPRQAPRVSNRFENTKLLFCFLFSLQAKCCCLHRFLGGVESICRGVHVGCLRTHR